MKKLSIYFFVLIMLFLPSAFAKYKLNLKSDSISIKTEPHVGIIGNVEETTEENKYNIVITNNNNYEVKYKIEEENNLFNIENDNMVDGFLSIPANTTNTVNFKITGKDSEVYTDLQINDEGYYYKNVNIYINEEKPYNSDKVQIGSGIKVILSKTGKNQIIQNSGPIIDYQENQQFGNASNDTEASLCSIIDPISGEKIYFYRGNVTNNYFSFAGKTWRILRINSDGSIRLILDNVISNSQYQTINIPTNRTIEGAIELISWKNSIAYTTLKDWYDNNIVGEYSSYVKLSDFVFDTSYNRTTSSANNTACYYFGPYLRVGVDGNAYKPTFSYDDNSLIQDYIGLISADEYLYAGGFWKKENKSFFLYNPSINTSCWTMSPSFWDDSQHYKVGMVIIGVNGEMHDWPSANTIADTLGLRPVISVRGDREIIGTGEVGNPYRYNN